MLKVPASGKLISLDGIAGSSLLPAAKKILKSNSLDTSSWTIWDASSIFFEMQSLEVDELPSARTLMLLYAADLYFRMRWQIVPALEEGRTIVAAPYVETAVGFGVATGLPKRWLNELFSFAPKASVAYWLDSPAARRASRPDGFIELCGAMLSEDFRPRLREYFKERSPKFQRIRLESKPSP